MHFIVILNQDYFVRDSLTINMICLEFRISVYDVLLIERHGLMIAITASHPL